MVSNNKDIPDSILSRWGLSVSELTKIIDENPSLRGILSGYVAEFQLRKLWFSDDRVTNVIKYDDHDRKSKNDLSITYKGYAFTIEVKSLQTSSIKRVEDTLFVGKFQCDASDRRKVMLPDGSQLETTCLLVDEFDLLAINLFGFTGKWDFGFALNTDLPRSSYRNYSPEQRKYLLASMPKISWPLQPPFSNDPFILLDKLAGEKQVLQ